MDIAINFDNLEIERPVSYEVATEHDLPLEVAERNARIEARPEWAETPAPKYWRRVSQAPITSVDDADLWQVLPRTFPVWEDETTVRCPTCTSLRLDHEDVCDTLTVTRDQTSGFTPRVQMPIKGFLLSEYWEDLGTQLIPTHELLCDWFFVERGEKKQKGRSYVLPAGFFRPLKAELYPGMELISDGEVKPFQFSVEEGLFFHDGKVYKLPAGVITMSERPVLNLDLLRLARGDIDLESFSGLTAEFLSMRFNMTDGTFPPNPSDAQVDEVQEQPLTIHDPRVFWRIYWSPIYFRQFRAQSELLRRTLDDELFHPNALCTIYMTNFLTRYEMLFPEDIECPAGFAEDPERHWEPIQLYFYVLQMRFLGMYTGPIMHSCSRPMCFKPSYRELGLQFNHTVVDPNIFDN